MREEWDGRPENPERDQWGWLFGEGWRHPTFPARWCATHSEWWIEADGDWWMPSRVAAAFTYLGPCLPPGGRASRLDEEHKR